MRARGGHTTRGELDESATATLVAGLRWAFVLLAIAAVGSGFACQNTPQDDIRDTGDAVTPDVIETADGDDSDLFRPVVEHWYEPWVSEFWETPVGEYFPDCPFRRSAQYCAVFEPTDGPLPWAEEEWGPEPNWTGQMMPEPERPLEYGCRRGGDRCLRHVADYQLPSDSIYGSGSWVVAANGGDIITAVNWGIVRFSVDTGEIVWSAPVGPRVWRILGVPGTDNVLVIVDRSEGGPRTCSERPDSDAMMLVDGDGKIVWSRLLHWGRIGALVVSEDGSRFAYPITSQFDNARGHLQSGFAIGDVATGVISECVRIDWGDVGMTVGHWSGGATGGDSWYFVGDKGLYRVTGEPAQVEHFPLPEGDPSARLGILSTPIPMSPTEVLWNSEFAAFRTDVTTGETERITWFSPDDHAQGWVSGAPILDAERRSWWSFSGLILVIGTDGSDPEPIHVTSRFLTAAADGTVLNRASNSIIAIEPETRFMPWTINVRDGEAIPPLLLDDGTLVVRSTAGVVAVFESNMPGLARVPGARMFSDNRGSGVAVFD